MIILAVMAGLTLLVLVWLLSDHLVSSFSPAFAACRDLELPYLSS